MNKRVIDVSCGDRFTVVIAEVEGDPMATAGEKQLTNLHTTIEQPKEDNFLDTVVTAQDFVKEKPRAKLTSVRKPVSVGASEIN